MIYKNNKSEKLWALDEGAKSTDWFETSDFGLVRANYLTNPMEHNTRLKIYIKNIPGYAFEFPIDCNSGDIIYKENIERNNANHIVKYNKLRKLAQDIARYNKYLIVEFYNGNHEVYDELNQRTSYIGSLKESKRKEILNA